MKQIIAFFQMLQRFGMESLGKYYSTYRAWVVDVDDPENLQRLKLIIPQVTGPQTYNFWAHPKGVFSGKGYGMQILPKKGDMVWVSFEGGCPEIPIWEHGHFAKKELPSGDDYKDKKIYWFKTPEGNFVKFNDTKKLIHIENPKGYYVEFNDKGISIVVDKDKGISLGTLNESKEPAVLGDTAMDLLNEFIDDLGKVGTITTSNGVTMTINTSPMWQPLVAKWKIKWKNFKSKKTTLD